MNQHDLFLLYSAIIALAITMLLSVFLFLLSR